MIPHRIEVLLFTLAWKQMLCIMYTISGVVGLCILKDKGIYVIPYRQEVEGTFRYINICHLIILPKELL